MKTHQIYYLVVIICLFLATGCSSIYLPNVPATPMLSSQGEGYVAGHINLKGHASGTIAVAATDHIAILGNGSFMNNGNESNNFGKQWLLEGGLGYFTKIGKEGRQILEVYVGYGVGNTLQEDRRAGTQGFVIDESREMDFNKIFAQVNYTSKRRQKLNLFGGKRELNYGTAIRLSRVGMQSFLLNGIDAAKEDNFFIEPVFYTRLQLINGLQLQYTSGFNVALLKNQYLKAGNSVFTLGLAYNF